MNGADTLRLSWITNLMYIGLKRKKQMRERKVKRLYKLGFSSQIIIFCIYSIFTLHNISSTHPVTLLLGKSELHIDVEEQKILFRDGTVISYDKCLIATAGKVHNLFLLLLFCLFVYIFVFSPHQYELIVNLISAIINIYINFNISFSLYLRKVYMMYLCLL